MTEIRVNPLESLNGIMLGWNREELQNKLGVPERTIKNTDYYQINSLHYSIHFDREEKIEYIELSNPKIESVQILLGSLNIFNSESIKLISSIEETMNLAYNKEDPEFPYSFIFPEVELSFWRPTLPENENDEEGRYFETVGIGIKGYYTE